MLMFTSLFFYMQGEREDRGNWALFAENKNFHTCVCVCISAYAGPETFPVFSAI